MRPPTAPQAPQRPIPPAAPSSPAHEVLGREDVRSIATAIVRAETQVLRDELLGRLVRIEDRLALMEKAAQERAKLPAAAPFVPTPAPTPVVPMVAPAAQPSNPFIDTAPTAIVPTPAMPPVVTPPVAPPPLPVRPPPPVVAPAPVALPPAPVVQQVAAPAPILQIDDAPLDIDVDLAFGGRRRKRIGVIFVVLLVLVVAGIITAAMISQAINNHSGH